MINTHGIRNGDGIDPDSSTDSYIFNCTFDNGDDCIAIKSGKNPEGYYVGKPTKCTCYQFLILFVGTAYPLAAKWAGGGDVLVQDCTAGELINGTQIKGTKERGGYVKNVTVADCDLMKITIFSALNYNNDGRSCTRAADIRKFCFENINLSKADVKMQSSISMGLKDPAHRLKKCSSAISFFLPMPKCWWTMLRKYSLNKCFASDGTIPAYIYKQQYCDCKLLMPIPCYFTSPVSKSTKVW